MTLDIAPNSTLNFALNSTQCEVECYVACYVHPNLHAAAGRRHAKGRKATR